MNEGALLSEADDDREELLRLGVGLRGGESSRAWALDRAIIVGRWGEADRLRMAVAVTYTRPYGRTRKRVEFRMISFGTTPIVRVITLRGAEIRGLLEAVQVAANLARDT